MLARVPAPAAVRRRPPATKAPGATGPSSQVLVTALQQSAGNGAVAQLLAAAAPLPEITGAGNAGLAGLLTSRRPLLHPARSVQRAPKGGSGAKQERAAWQEAGLVGGGALYDLVNKDLSIEKLVEMALPQLAGLASGGATSGFEAATEAGGTKGKVEAVGLETKEVTQVGEALTGWAQKAAEEWLKGKDGKEFLGKAQKLVNQHPSAAYWTIVGVLAAAIAGAVGTYFAGLVDPPEIKKAFEIKGVKIDAGVDLGKFRERILESAKLALSAPAGPGTAGVEATAKSTKNKEGYEGYELGASGSYSLGAGKLSGGYGYSTLTKQSSVNLGVAYKFQPLTLNSTFMLAEDGTGTLDTSVLAKLNEEMTLGAGASGALYGPGTEKTPLGFKLSLGSVHGKESDKITADLNPTSRQVTFGAEQVRSLWGGVYTLGMTGGTGGSGASVSYVRDALKADLKYHVDKEGKESVETGLSGKGGGAEAGVSLKYGLTDDELQKLTTHLGFTSPDQMLTFLNDIALELSEGEVTAKVTVAFKLRLKTVAAEIEGGVTAKESEDVGASAHAAVGWKLPKGVVVGVGAGGSYAPVKDKPLTPWMVGPELSIGHEALPIRLVGGVNIPVGPGSEGLPPVFGLSVAPAFEFLGGKKKKK